MNKDDFLDLTSLVNIDMQEMLSQVNDLDALKKEAGRLIALVEKDTKEVVTDPDTGKRTLRFLFDRIGLKNKLEQNKKYQKLGQKLNDLIARVPSQEIVEAIIEYEKFSQIYGTYYPIALNNDIIPYLPVGMNIDRTMIPGSLDNHMKKLLAKVWESIEKYYKSDK